MSKASKSNNPNIDIESQQSIFHRFQKWVVAAIVFCVFLYLGFSIWSGLDEIQTQLQNFNWWMFVAAIALTLSNYVLRFFKWHYLLQRLDVHMPFGIDAWNFTAGLSMAISPGKAGELLKPFVVRKVTGTPMLRTIPALVTERLTDGIAMLFLASLGISTYAKDQNIWLIAPTLIIAGGLALLASENATNFCLGILEKFPLLNKIIPKIREMVNAMRVCVAPIPLIWTVFLSVIAWGAECIAFQLIFQGLGVDASLDACFFVYAFATVAGSAMPGGLGVADGALIGGTLQFISNSNPIATTATILTRIATLWLGVGVGAGALLKLSGIIQQLPDSDETRIEDTQSNTTDANIYHPPSPNA